MNNSRIAILKQYVVEEPDEPFNLYALASEYLAEEPETALQYLQELLFKHPRYLGTYYQIGKLYQSFDRTEEAKDAFHRGISLALELRNAKILQELRTALNEILDEEA